MIRAAWIAAVACAVGVAIFFEWHTDEVTVVLAVMTLLSLVLGIAWPERAPASGAAIGFSVLVTHALSESTGFLRPHYMHLPVRTGDWAAMAIAGCFVTAAAWVGGWVRTKASEEALPHRGDAR